MPKAVKTPLKYEPYMNMKRLTDDYENIQKEMEMKTPKQTKSPYRLDNSVYRKSTLRSYDFDNYGQTTNVKHATLSQKKVFKYLPNWFFSFLLFKKSSFDMAYKLQMN